MRHGFLLAAWLVLLNACGCATVRHASPGIKPPRGVRSREYRVVVTGYCPCGECCSWRRTWFGFGPAVVKDGPNRGHRKDVGKTASGTAARRGTIAADTSVFPLGTVLWVPGYGYGRVEDRGSGIRGYHIDLFFPRHAEAERCGRSVRRIRAWAPPR